MLRGRWVLLVALVGAAALGAPAAGRAQELTGETLARSACPADSSSGVTCSPLSAHGGRLVWSSFDAATGTYRLMTWSTEGTAALPVPWRREPFDADLGPGVDGGTVAVYSRCAGDEAGPARGCVVREFSFVDGVERPVLAGVSAPAPLLPTAWRARIAFVGAPGHDRARRPGVCSREGERATGCRTLRGGPLGVPAGTPAPSAAPEAMDLRARRLVFSWFHNPRGDTLMRRREIRLVHDVLDGRRARVTRIARAGAGGAGNAAVFSPSLGPGSVFWARGGASCDYPSSPNVIGRFEIATGRSRHVSSPRLRAVARDGETTYLLQCGEPLGAAAGLLLVRTSGDPFEAPGPPRPEEATTCPPEGRSAWTVRQVLSRGRAWVGGTDLAVGGDGRAVATWATQRRRLAVRARGGRFRLAPGTWPGIVDARVAVAGDEVVMAWTDAPADDPDLGRSVGVVVGDLRGRFRRPRQLAPASREAPVGGIALAAGRAGDAVVAWNRSWGFEAALRAAGGAFVPLGPLGAPGVPGMWLPAAPAVAVDDAGAAVVGWLAPEEPPGHAGAQALSVHLAHREPGGRFTAPVTLLRSASVSRVQLALDGAGETTLAWIRHDGTSTRVEVAAGPPRGPLRPAQALSTPGVQVERELALAGNERGAAVVAWVERDAVRSVVRVMAAVRRPGAGFAPATPLLTVRGRVSELQAAMDRHGDAGVVWQQQCATRGRHVLASVGRAGRSPERPERVSGGSRGGEWPRLGIDDRGVLSVLWVRTPRHGRVLLSERRLR